MLRGMRSWDPLYGRIEMSEFEFGLLRLSEVQRLRYVRMCNINSLLVTGASEISRFEHTIGVMHLAKEWIRAHAVPQRIGNDIIAAAVLHDMQTGPFGHSMQYVLEDNEIDGSFIHEDLSHGWRSTYHQEILAGASFAGRSFSAPAYLGERWESVAAIIRGEGSYGPLIAGTMDLDNIDNVVRLAFHVGITGRDDCELPLILAREISSRNGEIYLPERVIPTVMRWQAIRRRLYELLLLDWAEFSAKAMLTRAIERAAAHHLIGADSWVRTDSEFLDYLDRHAIGEAQEVKDIVRRLRRGDLYEPIALLTTPSVDLYTSLSSSESKAELESELMNRAGVKGLKPLIHFILDKGKTDREVAFKSDFDGKRYVVGKSSRQLLAGLFVSSSALSESSKRSLSAAFRHILEDRGAIDFSLMPDPMADNSVEAQPTLI